MKIILYLVLIFHAIFHLLGFLKAFNLAQLNEITTTISKSHGILWMLAFLLFISTVSLMIFENNSWHLLAVGAILLSEYLIITTWRDSKYGSLINLIFSIILFLNWNGNIF